MTDGSELLRHYAESGSQQAFSAFVQLHMDRVYSSALRRAKGNAHAAQDIAQTVFCLAAREARPLSHHPMLIGWLYATTRHAAAMLVRSEVRRKRREARDQRDTALERSAAPEPSWTEIAPYLEASIDALGSKDRAAILLRYFSGLSFAKIGQRLGVSEDGARSRVDRAVDKLRAKLKRAGVTSTGGCLSAAMTAHVVKAAPEGAAASASGTALLQAAAASSGTAAAGSGLLTFFASSKLAAVAAALVVASGIYCVRRATVDANNAQAARRRIDSLSHELAAINSQIAGSDQANRRLQGRLSELQGQAARRQPSRAQAAADTAAAQQRLNQELEKNPRYWRLVEQTDRARIEQDDRLAALALGLTTEQLAKLNEIQLQSRLAAEHLQIHSRALGQDDDAQLSAERGKIDEQERAALISTVGPEVAAKLEDYGRADAANSAVYGVVLRTYGTDAPLTPQQGEALKSVLEANNPTYSAGKPFDAATTDWTKVYTMASTVLGASQLEALRSVQAEWQARIESNAVLNELQAAGEGAN